MKKIVGLHIKNTKNIGDLYCHPLDYFNLGCCLDVCNLTLDISKVEKDEIDLNLQEGDVLIVGGGAVARKIPRIMSKIRDRKIKVIAWGVGFTERNKLTLIEPYSHYSLRNGLALYGCRDYLPNSGIDYVPCVSCMHQLFDDIPEPENDIVVYSHNDLMLLENEALALGIPHKTNKDSSGFSEVIKFLASGKTIITSSYHGAYWGTLLGRKVAMIPFGTKFMNLKYRPPIVKNVSDGIEQATSFPDALLDARHHNVNFFKKVKDLAWKK